MRQPIRERGSARRRRLASLATAVGLLAVACTGSPSTTPTTAPISTTGKTSVAPATQPSIGQSGLIGTPTPLLGLNTGPAPWPPETKFLSQRLRALGLPPLGPEATDVHFHVNLVITVRGQQVPVPVGIGIDFQRGVLAEIHTHADRGTIHVEAGRPRSFTLGMVFGVWGVRFTPSCIGGYCSDGANMIRVFLDGQPYRSNPTQLELANEQVIVVTYGTEQQIPNPLPARFVYEGKPKPA